MIKKSFDHILLLGFGSPEEPGHIEPYLREVLRGKPVPEERFKEVVHHYQAIGGSSPYNRQIRDFARLLETSLHSEGLAIPVFQGMMYWHPFLKDTLGEIKNCGLSQGCAVILAPHRSQASYEKYIDCLEKAKAEVLGQNIVYKFPELWYDAAGFIEAHAAQIRRLIQSHNLDVNETPFVFSAHSIPRRMADQSRYEEEILTSSRLVAEKAGLKKWKIAYQSRSGSPRDPWLEPDILSVIRDLSKQGFKTVAAVPIGFLCDNAEILYDLDIEARQEAEKGGMRYLRSATILNDPGFISMIKQRILAAI